MFEGIKLSHFIKSMLFVLLTVFCINSFAYVTYTRKTWVPGHYENHRWIPGHYIVYTNRPVYRSGKVWVPAHVNRYRQYVPGHWVYR